MRLSELDRRKLDLILRNRLAPAYKLSLTTPLLVAISISIWLTPDAFARVEDEAVQISLEKTFVLEREDDTIRTYSREDLAKKNPEASKSAEDEISGQIISVIKSVGESQRSAKKIKGHRSDNQSTKEYFEKAAVGASLEDHDSNADPDAIRNQIGKESANFVARKTIEQTALWKQINKGLDFDLDFSKLFSSRRDPKQPQSKSGKIRYGLVLKDIKPDHSLEKARASIGSTLMDDEMEFAGNAEVEWTIGPITDEPNRDRLNITKRRLANGKEVSEEDLEALREYQAELNEGTEELEDPIALDKEAATDATVWQTGVTPKFVGNIKPAGKDAGEALASNKMPGLQITVTQEQGLYEYMTRTPSAEKAQYSEHRFKVPVVGTFSIGRRYNDKMEVISTSAHNVLLTKRLPAVSIHYYDQTEQVVTDLRHEEDNLAITALARTDAKVPDSKKKQRKNQRGYELGVTKRF